MEDCMHATDICAFIENFNLSRAHLGSYNNMPEKVHACFSWLNLLSLTDRHGVSPVLIL